MTLAELIAKHDQQVAAGLIEPFLFSIEPEDFFSSVIEAPEGTYGQAADGWDDAFLPRPIEGVVIA